MPACQHPNSSVLELRVREDGRRYRRRYCEDCCANFTTAEVPIEVLEALIADSQSLIDIRRVLLGALKGATP